MKLGTIPFILNDVHHCTKRGEKSLVFPLVKDMKAPKDSWFSKESYVNLSCIWDTGDSTGAGVCLWPMKSKFTCHSYNLKD